MDHLFVVGANTYVGLPIKPIQEKPTQVTETRMDLALHPHQKTEPFEFGPHSHEEQSILLEGIRQASMSSGGVVEVQKEVQVLERVFCTLAAATVLSGYGMLKM